MNKGSNKVCGIFVFTKDKKVLLVKKYNSKFWEIPMGDHTGIQNYLEVAQWGVFEKTSIELFNYQDELFKPLKSQNVGKNQLITYALFEEDENDYYYDDPDDEDIEFYEFVTLKEAKTLMGCSRQKWLLNQIRFKKS